MLSPYIKYFLGKSGYSEERLERIQAQTQGIEALYGNNVSLDQRRNNEVHYNIEYISDHKHIFERTISH